MFVVVCLLCHMNLSFPYLVFLSYAAGMYTRVVAVWLQQSSNTFQHKQRNQKNLPNFLPKKTPGMENSKPQNI